MATLLEPAWLGTSQVCNDYCDVHQSDSAQARALSNLRVMALVDPKIGLELSGLRRHGVDITPVELPSRQLATIDRTAFERATVVLLVPGSLAELLRRALIQKIRQLQKSVVVVLPMGAELSQILSEGASGVVPSSTKAVAMASALWSAHAQMELQRRMSADIRSLEDQLNEARIIGKAKSILAERLQLTEEAALAHLRAQAQHQDWSTVELAKTVIFVAELGRTQSAQASTSSRSKSRGRNRKRPALASLLSG